MSLESSAHANVLFKFSLSTSGRIANLRLTAYKLEGEPGEEVEVFYPEYDKAVVTFDAATDSPPVQAAAAKFKTAIQDFITESNF